MEQGTIEQTGDESARCPRLPTGFLRFPCRQQIDSHAPPLLPMLNGPDYGQYVLGSHGFSVAAG